MDTTPGGGELPISRSGERRIAERRGRPAKAFHVTFAQLTVIFNGSLKLVVGVYFIVIIAWRSVNPTTALFPPWVAVVFALFFVLSWMVDGINDIRRGIREA